MRFRHARNLLFLLPLCALTACAAAPTVPPAPDPKKALEERAQTYWNYRVDTNLVDCYPFEATELRNTVPINRYVRSYPGELVYFGAKVQDITFEGDLAIVKLDLKYSFAFTSGLPKDGLSRVLDDFWRREPDGQYYHLNYDPRKGEPVNTGRKVKEDPRPLSPPQKSKTKPSTD